MKKCLLSDASSSINHETRKTEFDSVPGTHFDHAGFSHRGVVAISFPS